MAVLSALFVWVCLLTCTHAVLDPRLTGTWSTKSKSVITGPGFYDPISDRFQEPENTGISYSFTADGYFEEAYYRALSNPTSPSCVSGLMQFQHGTYSVESNGSLVLTPLAVDGRQLVSNPCKGQDSTYYRFNQTEIFKRFEVQIDRFHNVKRLNLYQFDGTPMNPMYLVYEPPQMLPTQTLNPLVTASRGGKGKAKRTLSSEDIGPHFHQKRFIVHQFWNPDNWWWAGIFMIVTGGTAFLYLEAPWKY